jgi:hypothetical protein
LTQLQALSASGTNLSGDLTLAGANPSLTSTSGGNLTVSTTGNSSVYINNVQFSGSGIVVPGNLTVQGAMTYISSSVVDIGDNRIRLNVLTPGQRYGGLDVVDSGSLNQATASLLWDSQNDYWFISDSANPLVTNKLMGGPTGSFGSENNLTYGYLPRAQTGDTLENSLLLENGYSLNYNSGQFIVNASTGNTTIAGTLGVTGLTTLGQVSASNITAATASFGSIVIGGSTFDNITVNFLSTLNSVSASNVDITGTLSVDGLTTLGVFSGSNGNISNILTAYSASITNLQIGGTAPSTTNDVGIPGTIRYDNDFAYIYTNGKWKRTSLAVF